MKFVMKNRDFTEMPVPLELDFQIERYSWDAKGGSKQATITAKGDRAALWSLLNHFRAPVEIHDDRGNRVWWGYLADINSDELVGFGASIANMFNRVAVAFTDQNIRYTTQWSEDAELVAEYGKKEMLLSVSDVNETTALAARDNFLARRKKIMANTNLSGSGEKKATITLLGWYYTLDWQYYANSTGKESYETTGSGGREIGEDDRPILGQSIQIASATAWTATSIWLRPWKVGVPSDNLVVSLKADNAGVPGTTLASGQIGGADIATEADWLEFVLNIGVELQPATTYWIHVARSGAVVFEGPDYFMVDTNADGGYANGSILLYNTNLSAWAAEVGQPGDLLFKVVGTTETTSQIATLVAVSGQFFEGVIVENLSGIQSNPFRDGDTPGLFELEKILDGGTTNYRRLLCEVTHTLYLRVYEEPATPADPKTSYGLTKNRILVTSALTPVDPASCPVAIWCHLVDVIPPTVDLALVADPSLFFIEEAEYDVASGSYNILRTRDQVDVFEIGGAVQG